MGLFLYAIPYIKPITGGSAMSLTELFIIAVGLSMDAFAVAVCKGLAMPRMSWKGALIVGLYFGGFQAAMPLLGYFLGSKFSMAIRAYDHWVAFLLLVLIGAGMVKESFEKDESCANASLDVRGMVLLAVATSIDALAVGVTFAFLNVDIVPAVSFIGAVTFTLSMVGVKVGNAFGCKYKSRAELAGGAILILMGLKILLEHLGLLVF